jgi:hypothetical protein
MTRCQSGKHPAGPVPAAFLLTFESAPVESRGARLPGLRWTEAACRSCADQRKEAVRKEGGTLVGVEDVPPPPVTPPVQPEPVGLDAIDPVPPAEPVKVRVQRRRRSSGGEG